MEEYLDFVVHIMIVRPGTSVLFIARDLTTQRDLMYHVTKNLLGKDINPVRSPRQDTVALGNDSQAVFVITGYEGLPLYGRRPDVLVMEPMSTYTAGVRQIITTLITGETLVIEADLGEGERMYRSWLESHPARDAYFSEASEQIRERMIEGMRLDTLPIGTITGRYSGR